MEYTLLHGNTKLQALIHKLAEWFQSQNVQLEILYGPFFFSHCQGSTFQKLCQGPNTFHIYLVGSFSCTLLCRLFFARNSECVSIGKEQKIY